MSEKGKLTTWFCTDASAEHYEIEDGEVYHVDAEGMRSPVTDPHIREILLEGSQTHEELEAENDKEPLSYEVAGLEFTVGDLSHKYKVKPQGE